MEVTETQFNKIYTTFNRMRIKAKDYVPPKELTERFIRDGNPDMILFGMWIDETGTTAASEDTRALKNRLNSILVFPPEPEED